MPTFRESRYCQLLVNEAMSLVGDVVGAGMFYSSADIDRLMTALEERLDRYDTEALDKDCFVSQGSLLDDLEFLGERNHPERYDKAIASVKETIEWALRRDMSVSWLAFMRHVDELDELANSGDVVTYSMVVDEMSRAIDDSMKAVYFDEAIDSLGYEFYDIIPDNMTDKPDDEPLSPSDVTALVDEFVSRPPIDEFIDGKSSLVTLVLPNVTKHSDISDYCKHYDVVDNLALHDGMISFAELGSSRISQLATQTRCLDFEEAMQTIGQSVDKLGNDVKSLCAS